MPLSWRSVSQFFWLFLLVPQISWAATDCPLNPDGYYTTQADYLAAQVWCSEFTSRFDGKKDYFFLKFPPGFNKDKPVNLILWFRALGQSDGAISDPRMFNGDPDSKFPGVPALYNAIVIGLGQRGTRTGDNTCNFLGDFTPSVANPGFCPAPAGPARQAAKEDILELIHQLSSRFKINHVFAAGASMGGYTALRLVQLYPQIFSGAITSATALCANSESGPPNCAGGWVPEGSREIYEAAKKGVFDDKLIYVVVGAKDAPDLLAGVRYFDGLMRGKPFYRFREIPGEEHENFFADDYNTKTLGKTAWLVSNPKSAPNLQADIQGFIAGHPRAPLAPTPGWAPPAVPGQWYLSDRILQ